MPCPGLGPCCAWNLPLACLDSGGNLDQPCVGGQPVPPDVLISATLAASQLVWAITGRQFGVCTVTTRPVRPDCGGDWDSGLFNPSVLGWYGGIGAYDGFFPFGGNIINFACGCVLSCGCGTRQLSEVYLPYPTCSIVNVIVDGVTLPSTAYRIDDFRKLVRVDGNVWPRCQDFSLNDGPGTWSITLTYGKPVPELCSLAAGEIACEIIKSILGQACKLPQRIQTITRQGIAVHMLDPQSYLKEGRTGFTLADLAIRTYNPKMLARAPGVYSPDAPDWRVPT